MRLAPATALLLAACTHVSAFPGDAGGDAQVAVAIDAATVYAVPVEEAPPPTFGEARRARLTKLDDEPGLARNDGVIRAHFGGVLPAAMELQAVPLASGKQALLLRALGDDPRPIALLVDATGAALWTKERPLAGITPPAKPFTIAARPDNGVALFFYDEPTKLMAARMWDANGAPFAELQLFGLARCDAISAAWWPGKGWIVVASFPGGARAVRLGEDGSPAWDPGGIAVGEGWRAPAPVTIVIDTELSSWVLVQHATRGGGDHVVAVRYGMHGERVTKAAVDLGKARVTAVSDRIDATLVRAGVVRVDLGGKRVEAAIDATR